MLGNLFEENDGNSCKASRNYNVHTFSGNAPPPGRLHCALCGLENQGATCYLNSLLQTLLYTPEFRDGLFQVEEEELSKNGGKIPLQLQHLFASLLLADQQAVSTTELTNSFGWNNHEELQQHDVQELNRILFCAIETSLVGTSGSNLISRLYRGSIVNQICCQECKYMSAREEDFLDLNVIVRGFSDLQSSLNASYQQQEVMRGKNQYHCISCNRLVDAKKGMKIRKLPPILTFSLLRFNFDYVKGERFKESGRFAFPLILNMNPYCEKAHEENEAVYELFSVVIHSGSSNRGHYHVYIRDIDNLGNWVPLENKDEENKACANGAVVSLENPVKIIESILSQQRDRYLSLDSLCLELAKLTGLSWNKQFKRTYGPINKFLLKHDDVFMYNQATNTIHLKESNHSEISRTQVNGNLTNGIIVNGSLDTAEEIKVLTTHCNEVSSIQESHKNSVKAGSNWFDFNDTRITPIRAKEIESQFGGKESAYMLFYRRKSLLRPIAAQNNPSFNVPSRLCDLIEKENCRLREWRKEYEEKLNSVNLKIHFGAAHQLQNGGLEALPNSLSGIDISIDRRKTVQELKQRIIDVAYDLCPNEHFSLSFARELPAGLHLYDEVKQEQFNETLERVGILEGTRLFVWDGKQIGGESIQVGPTHEPVLLTITCVLPSGISHELTPRGFPKSLTLGELRAIICSLTSIDVNECVISRVQFNECDNNNIVLDCNQNDMTIQELGLLDGDSLHIENKCLQENDIASLPNADLPSTPLHKVERKIKITVQNRCGVYGDLPAFECPQQEFELMPDMLVVDLISEAVLKLNLDGNRPHNLRRVSESQMRKVPYYEDITVKQAGIDDGACICIEEGKSPLSSQVTVLYSIGANAGDQADFEINVDKSTSVSECLKQMLALANIEGDSWHLRRTNWNGEPSKVLPSDKNTTLEKEGVQHGDLLLILEGRQPPKGYLSLPVFIAPSPDLYIEEDNTSERHFEFRDAIRGLINSCSPSDHGNPVRIGEVEVSSESMLSELKKQVLTLPFLASLNIPSIRFLRLRVLDCGRLGRVLKGVTNTLKKLKLVNLLPIYVQLLPVEEDMLMTDVLLCVSRCFYQSGLRFYTPPTEVVWNAGKSAHSGSLKKFLSSRFRIQMDKLCMAKHFPDICEWKIIDFPNCHKASSNRKKHDNKVKLKVSPYFLRDGDTIGIKDYSVDPDPNFSTKEDEDGKKLLEALKEEKRQTRANSYHKNKGDWILGGGDDEASQNRKWMRTPEVGITIHVDGVSDLQHQ